MKAPALILDVVVILVAGAFAAVHPPLGFLDERVRERILYGRTDGDHELDERDPLRGSATSCSSWS